MKSYCKRDCYVCACKNDRKNPRRVYKASDAAYCKMSGRRKEKLLKVVEKYIYKRIYNIYI